MADAPLGSPLPGRTDGTVVDALGASRLGRAPGPWPTGVLSYVMDDAGTSVSGAEQSARHVGPRAGATDRPAASPSAGGTA